MQDSIIDQILSESNLGASHKLLLLVIARHAHRDGTNAYPSLRRLQTLTSRSLAHVCVLLKELEASGHLIIAHGQAPKGGNLYTVPLMTALATGAPTDRAPGSGARSTGAPASRTEGTPEEEKRVLAQPVAHQSAVLQSPEHEPVTYDDPGLQTGRKFVTPGSPADQAIQELVPAPPTRTRPRNRGTRGALRLVSAHEYVGKLCPKGHRAPGEEGSLRRHPSGTCVECNRAGNRKRRQG